MLFECFNSDSDLGGVQPHGFPPLLLAPFALSTTLVIPALAPSVLLNPCSVKKDGSIYTEGCRILFRPQFFKVLRTFYRPRCFPAL